MPIDCHFFLLAYVLTHITRNPKTIAKHTVKNILMPLYIINIHYGNYSQQNQVPHPRQRLGGLRAG